MSKLKDMELDIDVQDSKEFKKILNLMGKQDAKEFINKSDDDLKKMLLVNQMHAKEVDETMKNNGEYIKVCRIKKDFEDAKRDRLKITKATTDMASLILYKRKKEREKIEKLEKAEESMQNEG